MNAQQRQYNAFRVAYDVKGIRPEHARAIVAVCDGIMAELFDTLYAYGLKANNNDLAHVLESAIYAYIKASNPGTVADMLTTLEWQGGL